MIIVFEGIDGGGKSEHIKTLYDQLVKDDYKVHLYREPGGTAIGESIRKVLKMPNLSRRANALLYLASRTELCTDLKRNYQEGDVVLLDRFTPSTLAYNCTTREEMEKMAELDKFARFGIEPDLVFQMIVNPEVAVARIKARGEDPPSVNTLSAIASRYELAYDVLGWKAPRFGIETTARMPKANSDFILTETRKAIYVKNKTL